jgi:hypothetical protein
MWHYPYCEPDVPVGVERRFADCAAAQFSQAAVDVDVLGGDWLIQTAWYGSLFLELLTMWPEPHAIHPPLQLHWSGFPLGISRACAYTSPV